MYMLGNIPFCSFFLFNREFESPLSVLILKKNLLCSELCLVRLCSVEPGAPSQGLGGRLPVLRPETLESEAPANILKIQT